MSKYIGATVVNLSVDTVDVTGDITATDSTPELILLNDTHEDTDGGREGKITFKGEQSGGEVTVLAQIQSGHDGTSDDEKGDLIFKTNDGSDGASPTERLRIDSDGVTTFTGNIANTSGDLTLDIVGDLIIDVDGGDVKFKDDGTEFSQYYKDGNDLAIYSSISDGDIKFQGKDGSSVVTAMTIDMSEGGKIGMGTTSPVTNLDVVTESAGTLARIRSNTNSSPSAGLQLMRGTTSTFGGDAYTDYSIENINGGHLVFNLAENSSTTEIMRIESGAGKFLIGTTTVQGAGHTFSASQYNLVAGATSTLQVVQFRNPNGKIGTIVLSGSSTAYNTSSDYRLKENVETLSGAITRVKALKPKRFSWIADEENSANVDGFLAHEAATVVPEAVTGTKDEVEVWQDDDVLPDGVSVGDNKLDADGNTIPEYQGIDQAKLVPLLTAALQEAIAKIETLETKVAALEGE
tara:strand:- start:239 stop:1627 length:1389 start_codon:yes stop_codon:yes gene_type:complete